MKSGRPIGISKVWPFRHACEGRCARGVDVLKLAAPKVSRDATAEWDAAGFPWMGARDLGGLQRTDAGRTDHGLHSVRNGEEPGQWPFRWGGMNGL